MNQPTNEGFPPSECLSSFCLTARKISILSGSKVNKLPIIREESVGEAGSEIGSESIEKEEISTKSSLNINCLMNVNLKQSRSIWKTIFGKRLLNLDNFSGALNLPEGTIGRSQPSKSIITKKFKPCKKDHIKDKIQSIQTGNSEETVERKSSEISKEESLHEGKFLERIPNSSEVTSKISEIFSFSKTSASTLPSKLTPLTEHIKRIFEADSTPFTCDFCSETFSDIEKLCSHQKRHDYDKKTCLLCDKVFYNSSKFTRHLFTHEGVDRFSCKKCKIYFPNLMKYQRHAQDVHFEHPVLNFIRPSKVNSVEKFECKNCKLEFNSAKKCEAHKRSHLKKDLTEAYFLLYNNV